MVYEVPKLGFEFNALENFIDAKTMEIHHDKHHQAYVDKLNKALEGHEELSSKDVEELLVGIDSVPSEIKQAVINHGGGHSNHSFFWSILSPENQESFEGEVSKAMHESFSDLGSYQAFKDKFEEIAMTRFGSGWAWMVYDKASKKLELMSTGNQDSPLMQGKVPLIGLDLWEHAYYLKYQNKRADYVKNFWQVVNWKKVEELYLKAKGN
jgi:Fe-Mn family superoxide dismutase